MVFQEVKRVGEGAYFCGLQIYPKAADDAAGMMGCW